MKNWYQYLELREQQRQANVLNKMEETFHNNFKINNKNIINLNLLCKKLT